MPQGSGPQGAGHRPQPPPCPGLAIHLSQGLRSWPPTGSRIPSHQNPSPSGGMGKEHQSSGRRPCVCPAWAPGAGEGRGGVGGVQGGVQLPAATLQPVIRGQPLEGHLGPSDRPHHSSIGLAGLMLRALLQGVSGGLSLLGWQKGSAGLREFAGDAKLGAAAARDREGWEALPLATQRCRSLQGFRRDGPTPTLQGGGTDGLSLPAASSLPSP